MNRFVLDNLRDLRLNLSQPRLLQRLIHLSLSTDTINSSPYLLRHLEAKAHERSSILCSRFDRFDLDVVSGVFRNEFTDLIEEVGLLQS
jgi:hypothetical protein